MKRLIKLTRKTLHVLRRGGINAVLERLDTLETPSCKIDVPNFYDFIMDDEKIPFSKEEYNDFKGKTTTVNWIIPEMGIGSGGHINIFRFVTLLQKKGINNRIYVHRGTKFQNDQELKSFLEINYNLVNNGIEVYSNINNIKFAHATIATSWITAYFVRKFDNTISKFYFVQDFEPYFYPIGSEYKFAENTYKFGFRGITAGEWLKNKLSMEYNMITDSFGFSFDKEIYKPVKKRDDKNRLFFYARPVTPRRSFELGLLALNELYKRIPDIEVIFAGWDISNYEIPFIHLNAGSVNVNELSDLYGQCDLCVVMSSTNLSLLPLEIMASNSVVVCNEGENNSWLLNNENSIVVDEDPIQIAQTLEYYLKNKKELQKFREKGLEITKSTSWELEAEKVKKIILRGIEEDEKN